jgi:flagellar motor switch protein FliG
MALKMRTAKKLAIFFTSIPREKAISIMKHFSINTMESIASEIRSLGTIPTEVQGSVFEEISSKLVMGVDPTGGEEVAWQILNGVIGEEEAKKLLERAKPRKPKPFSTITNVSGQDLATILSNEQPATAAIILSFFPPKKVGEVLSFLEEEIREEIIVRLALDREADNEVVERIEEIFVEKVTSSINPTDEEERTNLGGPDFVAELFQGVDKQLEEELISSIQEESPELADKIRDLMFTFEDVVNLTDVDVQKVLREIPTDKLVLALRGAKKEVAEKFTNNLSKRAKENLEEEMSLMGKVKKSEVENERKAIVGVIRALEAAGEITVSSGEDEDVYV